MYAQKSFVLKSPGGNLSTTIVASEQLTYDVVCNGRQIMAPSNISMTLDNGTVWGTGVRIQKVGVRVWTKRCFLHSIALLK